MKAIIETRPRNQDKDDQYPVTLTLHCSSNEMSGLSLLIQKGYQSVRDNDAYNDEAVKTAEGFEDLFSQLAFRYHDDDIEVEHLEDGRTRCEVEMEIDPDP